MIQILKIFANWLQISIKRPILAISLSFEVWAVFLKILEILASFWIHVLQSGASSRFHFGEKVSLDSLPFFYK